MLKGYLALVTTFLLSSFLVACGGGSSSGGGGTVALSDISNTLWKEDLLNGQIPSTENTYIYITSNGNGSTYTDQANVPGGGNCYEKNENSFSFSNGVFIDSGDGTQSESLTLSGNILTLKVSGDTYTFKKETTLSINDLNICNDSTTGVDSRSCSTAEINQLVSGDSCSIDNVMYSCNKGTVSGTNGASGKGDLITINGVQFTCKN